MKQALPGVGLGRQDGRRFMPNAQIGALFMEASQIAQVLAHAARDRKQLDPFTAAGELDLATAYDAQWLGVQARVEAGDPVIGYKLGLTSAAKQKTMNVDEPLYGQITASMMRPVGAPITVDEYIHPRIEPELVFQLGADIEGPATIADVLSATEAVYLGVDVLDSRYADYKFTLADVAADNASAGAHYLGPVGTHPQDLIDLALVGVVVRKEGKVVYTAAGAATMGHPAAAVAWLANKLAERDQSLKAGQLVYSGGLTDAVAVETGSSYSVEADKLGVIELAGL